MLKSSLSRTGVTILDTIIRSITAVKPETLVRDDEGDLSARHHTDAYLEAVRPLVAKAFRDESAADNFAQQSHSDESDREEYHTRIDAAEIGFQTDTDEKHRREEHIAVYADLAVDVVGVAGVAEDNTRDVSARDIGDTEILLGDERHNETEPDSDYRYAAGVRVLLVVPLEQLIEDEAEYRREHEEEHDLPRHEEGIAVGVLEAEHKGEHDDTDDVIDDSGAEDSLPDAAVEMTHFLEDLDGDTDGGRGHNAADEDRLEEFISPERREAVYSHIEEGTSRERHKHADTGDDESGEP